MSRRSHLRAKDDAAEMADEEACSSRAWSRLRRMFPKPVRDRVDAVAASGGLSLHDIELLEFAAHEVVGERIKRLERRPKTSTAVASSESIRLQSRKHLRVLRLAQTPIGTPNDMRHPEPDVAARRREAQARLADLAAAPGTQAEPRPRDTGDELLN